MVEYEARKEAEARTVTRFLLCSWIAEMAWVCLFAMPNVVNSNACSTKGFVDMTLLFSLNYVVPLWFLLRAFGFLVIGRAAEAQAALKDGMQRTLTWYRAAPTLTFVAIGLLVWTTYNVAFRYHVSLEFRDSYPDDLAQVRTSTDWLTGITARRVFTESQCYDTQAAEEEESRPNP